MSSRSLTIGTKLTAWYMLFMLIGGLLALSYIIVKSQYGNWTALRRRITMDGVALYWHFIDGVWIFLFALLFLWK